MVVNIIVTSTYAQRFLAHITQWATARQLLPETQFGFRKNRRVTDCAFIVNTLVEQGFFSRNVVFGGGGGGKLLSWGEKV